MQLTEGCEMGGNQGGGSSFPLEQGEKEADVEDVEVHHH